MKQSGLTQRECECGDEELKNGYSAVIQEAG
jgi:hypothetical protein